MAGGSQRQRAGADQNAAQDFHRIGGGMGRGKGDDSGHAAMMCAEK